MTSRRRQWTGRSTSQHASPITCPTQAFGLARVRPFQPPNLSTIFWREVLVRVVGIRQCAYVDRPSAGRGSRKIATARFEMRVPLLLHCWIYLLCGSFAADLQAAFWCNSSVVNQTVPSRPFNVMSFNMPVSPRDELDYMSARASGKPPGRFIFPQLPVCIPTRPSPLISNTRPHSSRHITLRAVWNA